MLPRYYTLYKRDRGTKTWKRISDYSYKKDTAIRIFQGRILDNLLACMPHELRIRPIPRDKFGA